MELASNVVSIVLKQQTVIAAQSIHKVTIFAYEVDKNLALETQHDHQRFLWFQQSLVNGGKPSTTVPAHILNQAILNMKGVEKPKNCTNHILLVADGGLLVMKSESGAAPAMQTRRSESQDSKDICNSTSTMLIRPGSGLKTKPIQGIVNSNNSCWINAAFQCFLALQSVQDLLATPQSPAFHAYKKELLVLNQNIHSIVSKPVASIEKNLKSLVVLFPSSYELRGTAQENSFLLFQNLINISEEVKRLFCTKEIQTEQCMQCCNTVQADTRCFPHHVLDVSTICSGHCKNVKAMLELNAFHISLTKHCQKCKNVTKHTVLRSSSYSQVICFEFSRDIGDSIKLTMDHFQVEHTLQVRNNDGSLQSFELSTACIHIGETISNGHFIVLRIVIDSQGTSYWKIDDSKVTLIDLATFNTYLKDVSYVLYTARSVTKETEDTAIRPSEILSPLSVANKASVNSQETVPRYNGRIAPSVESGFCILNAT